MTRSKVLLLLLAFAAVTLAGAAVLALRAWPSDAPDSASALSKSREAEQKILDEATEGKVFHFATREFRRHGAGDPLIRRMSDEWYMPESYDREYWAQVGPAGAITRWHGVATDREGNLVQEARDDGDMVVTRDVASGAEERLPLDATVESIAHNVGEGVRDLEEKMNSGAVKTVGNGDIDGKNTIVLEWPPELEPAEPGLPPGSFGSGYTLPYTLDLDSLERVQRLEIDTETFLPVHLWWMAVGAAGDEYLIEEWTVIANEILDPAAVPAWVFEGR